MILELLTPSMNAKLCTAWIFGLAVLIGSSDVSFARPKLLANKTYCDCSCNTFSGGKELMWEKVASCSLNGKACSATNSAGKLEPGTLQHCQQCTTGGDANFNSCVEVKAMPGGLSDAPEPGVMGSPTDPKVPPMKMPPAPGMRDQIMRRGIDDAELLSEPPTGKGPSEPTTR